MDQTLEPNPWMILPFGILLAAIAVGPLLFAKWWTRHYAKVTFALAAVTLVYYFFGFHGEAARVARHHVWEKTHEYISFILLIGSLFVVSGGIHINVKGEATPFNNVVLLLIGAIISNVLGTTGASMLLIRPWIRMNKYRITAHHIVFFIFIVSNVGGCLTPIGDPPLFLGYLKGIPFFWVAQHCWPMWAVGVGFLLAVFYVVDSRNYHRAPKQVRAHLAEPHDSWRFEGLGNIVYLVIILVAVFINRPIFLREAIMLGAALASYFTTRKHIHEANHFHFHPIEEVAILFVGIFATMIPALDWLEHHAGTFGNPSAAFFYWGTGTLSSLLDNAPTYLSFLSAAFGAFIDPEVVDKVHQLLQTHGAALPELTGAHAQEIQSTFNALQTYHASELASGKVTTDQIETAFLLGNAGFNKFIVAISVGAVFFGANTYIGNGPNFMVKSIADHQRVHTPGFIGYILKFTLPIMVPLLVLVWWLFFRG